MFRSPWLLPLELMLAHPPDGFKIKFDTGKSIDKKFWDSENLLNFDRGVPKMDLNFKVFGLNLHARLFFCTNYLLY